MNRGVPSLRAKLVVLVALPLALLLTVTGTLAVDRARVATEAGEVDQDVRAALEASSLAIELRVERDRTNRIFAEESAETGAALEDARAQTDAALAEFGRAVASLGSDNRAQFGPASEALDGLSGIRAAVDVGPGAAAAPAFAWYTASIDAVLGATGGIDVGDGAGLERLAFGVEALGRTSEALAVERDVLVAAAVRGALTGDDYANLVRARAAQELWRAESARVATPAQASALDRVFDQGAATVVVDARAQAGVGPAATIDVDEAAWTAAASALVDGVDGIRADATSRLLATSNAALQAAGEERDLYLGVSVLATVLLIAITVLVGRWVRRPISALTAAAVDVARNRLPAAVAAAADPDAPPVEVVPVTVAASGELGHLAEAFNQMQATAVELATEQAAMRRDVNELFVSLGRRSQKLVSRQLAFIDRLEKREQDPEVLENLFRLDHLATRMRRNAESLLVLAGTETPRTWLAPVEVGDTIRAAVAEVEHYERVEIRAIASAQVRGNVSANVSHLLAELIENALNFSPPGTPVVIAGRADADHYVIDVIDDGMGIEPADQDALNARLANPLARGQSLSRFLGIEVVARLAQRYGITVHLADSDLGGTHARVVLPASVLETPPAAPAVDVAGAHPGLPNALSSGPSSSPASVPAPAVGTSGDPSWAPAAAAPFVLAPAERPGPVPSASDRPAVAWTAPAVPAPEQTDAIEAALWAEAMPWADAAPIGGWAVPTDAPPAGSMPAGGTPAAAPSPAAENAPVEDLPAVPSVPPAERSVRPVEFATVDDILPPAAARLAPSDAAEVPVVAPLPPALAPVQPAEPNAPAQPVDLAPGREPTPMPSGLRRRTPRATLAAAEHASGGGAGSRTDEPAPFRDAAEVRDLLSQFQAGVLRAQVGLESSEPADGDGGGARP